MRKLSLITSLYRSEKHLPKFIQRAENVLAQVSIPIELVLVANDATPEESTLLENFSKHEVVTVLHCSRESLYASWNRGIHAAQGDFLGFWNVDDSRTIEGLEEAFHLLSDEAELVDFAFEIEESGKVERYPANYRPPSLYPRDTVTAFFVFRRSLFEKAGDFNPHFKIVGDYEWAAREVVRNANYSASEVLAGRFILHEDNLSAGRNPLEWVEFNLALLKHNAPEFLRPVDPHLMRQTWESWGKDYITMPQSLQNWFWGERAEQRLKEYHAFRKSLWKQRYHAFLHRLGLAPKDPFTPPI